MGDTALEIGLKVAARNGDFAGPSSIHTGQAPNSKMLWRSSVPAAENDPYVNEWNDLISAIRNDKPYNEVERGVKASVVGSALSANRRLPAPSRIGWIQISYSSTRSCSRSA